MLQEICKDIVDLSIAVCSRTIILGHEGISRITEDAVNRYIAEYAGPDPTKICNQFQILLEVVDKVYIQQWKSMHPYMNDLLTDSMYGCRHLCGSTQAPQDSFVCTSIYLLTASILMPDTKFAPGELLYSLLTRIYLLIFENI